MAISESSKSTIREKIDKLESRKTSVIKRIQELGSKRDVLIAQRESLKDQINALSVDLG
jgi:uncharacterized coiled-coil DUF342 family protein